MIPETEVITPDLARRREAHRRRSEAYRDRKRRRVLVVSVEVERETLAGLERLGLLTSGERDCYEVACAVARFLTAARPMAAIGDALYPEPRERDASPDKNDDLDGD